MKQTIKENIEPLTFRQKLKHDESVWKVSIDTQIHFNELLIKMRTTVISVVLTVFGAVMVTFEKAETLHFLKWNIHIGIVILILGLGFLLAQFLLDFFYYFRLLLGAVKFTEKIDDKYEKQGLFGLTTSISNSITECRAKLWLIIFYFIPFVLGLLAIYVIHCKFPITIG